MTQQEAIRWATAAAVVLGAWAVGWMLRGVLVRGALTLTRRTPTGIDDVVLRAVKPHIPLWFLALGTAIAARMSVRRSSLVSISSAE